MPQACEKRSSSARAAKPAACHWVAEIDLREAREDSSFVSIVLQALSIGQAAKLSDFRPVWGVGSPPTGTGSCLSSDDTSLRTGR